MPVLYVLDFQTCMLIFVVIPIMKKNVYVLFNQFSLITKYAVLKLRQVYEICEEYSAKLFHEMTIHNNYHNV